MDAGDPRGAIVVVFDALYAMSMWVLLTHIPVYVLYWRAVRGTRMRYLMSSIVPVLCIVGIFAWSGRLLADVLAEREWWYYPLDGLCVFSSALNWRSWKRDRDDDFWKGLGGRLRARLRRRGRQLAGQYV